MLIVKEQPLITATRSTMVHTLIEAHEVICRLGFCLSGAASSWKIDETAIERLSSAHQKLRCEYGNTGLPARAQGRPHLKACAHAVNTVSAIGARGDGVQPASGARANSPGLQGIVESAVRYVAMGPNTPWGALAPLSVAGGPGGSHRYVALHSGC